ncbi:MAG: class I SAM-dependent methyltransferase [Gammaproteobacteria bacterium]|nr:class I SAM-dependent methyltransferase [Gammaproteobacteria bacterium]
MSKPMLRSEQGMRLAYFLRGADAGYWEQHWEDVVSAEFYAGAENGRLGIFEKIFPRYLPRRGSILEAGCGLGQYVMALRARGYQAEGLDWAEKTVVEVHRRFPDLPVQCGDATRIPVADGQYAGYISLGVIEHSQEGPGAYLVEAHRVLAPGGVALVSVPCMHAVRRLKARLGCYRDIVAEADFYQYAFRRDDLQRELETAGFQVEAWHGYDSYKGIKDEIPWFAAVFSRRIAGFDLGYATQRALSHLPGADRFLGHMLMAVCRKPMG